MDRLRGRSGAHDGHLGGARRGQPRRLLRRGRGGRSACGPSCCRARRRVGSRSSGRPPTSIPALGPFLVVDIGGGSTEFSYGTTECEASALARHRLRALHREVPRARPAPARGAVGVPVGGRGVRRRRRRATSPRSPRPARSSAWPARSRRRPRSSSAWRPTTATGSTTSS